MSRKISEKHGLKWMDGVVFTARIRAFGFVDIA